MQKSLLKQDSQFSILHPGEGKRERRGSSGSKKKPSHLELIESWGVWGRGFLKGLYCLTQKKKKNQRCPRKIFLSRAQVHFRVCFAWQIFLSSSCSCLECANQQCENTTAEMVRNYVKLTSFNKILRHSKVWIQTLVLTCFQLTVSRSRKNTSH